MSTLPFDVSFDDFCDGSSTNLPAEGWITSTGAIVKQSTENTRELFESTNEPNVSTTFSLEKPINDSLVRRKIWAELFKGTPEPEPQVGSIGESFGLLDACFADNKLSIDDVLEILKKAK